MGEEKSQSNFHFKIYHHKICLKNFFFYNQNLAIYNNHMLRFFKYIENRDIAKMVK